MPQLGRTEVAGSTRVKRARPRRSRAARSNADGKLSLEEFVAYNLRASEASGLWADFERAKQMILNHLAFKILHRNARKRCPPEGEEVCWASEYIKTLPVRC